MTYKEILEKLKSSNISVKSFAYQDFDPNDIGAGNVEEVSQEGGEGQGDHWESVKHFVDHDIYIKVVGFYTSHYGTDFDDYDSTCSEVRPKTKTIQVYE